MPRLKLRSRSPWIPLLIGAVLVAVTITGVQLRITAVTSGDRQHMVDLCGPSAGVELDRQLETSEIIGGLRTASRAKEATKKAYSTCMGSLADLMFSPETPQTTPDQGPAGTTPGSDSSSILQSLLTPAQPD